MIFRSGYVDDGAAYYIELRLGRFSKAVRRQCRFPSKPSFAARCEMRRILLRWLWKELKKGRSQ